MMSAPTHKDEINLADILAFLLDAWKIILGLGLAGALAAVGMLAATPAQYEAEAMLEMAQALSVGPNGTVVKANIESPALLIERLKRPSSYTPEAIQGCSQAGAGLSGEAMAGLVMASSPRDVSVVAAIKVRRGTPALAEQCAKGLFEMIRRQQEGLLKPHRDELRSTLEGLQARLSENRSFVSKAEKAGLYGMVYLARRDETMYLLQQIDELQRLLARDEQARLVAPVYASPSKVAPRSSQILITGAFGGLIFGLLIALVRRLLPVGQLKI